MCGVFALHPKISKHVTGHTLNVGSGGVLSTGSAADAELAPVLIWCGIPVLGAVPQPLAVVASQVMDAIIHNQDLQLQHALPDIVSEVIRAGLEEHLGAQIGYEQYILDALAASLQLQAHLQLRGATQHADADDDADDADDADPGPQIDSSSGSLAASARSPQPPAGAPARPRLNPDPLKWKAAYKQISVLWTRVSLEVHRS